MYLPASEVIFSRYPFAGFPLLSIRFLATIYHIYLAYIIDNKEFTYIFSID